MFSFLFTSEFRHNTQTPPRNSEAVARVGVILLGLPSSAKGNADLERVAASRAGLTVEFD